MVDACTATGILPFYGPFGDIKDVVGCEAQFRTAFLLGCVGAWSLHPVQIDDRQEGVQPRPRRGRASPSRSLEAMPRRRAASHMIDGKMQDDATWKQCQGDGRRWPSCWPTRDPELAEAYGFARADGVVLLSTCGSRPKPTTPCAPSVELAAADGREAGQGRARRHRSGHPAQLPGEHPRRAAPRRHRPQPPRRRGRLPPGQAGRGGDRRRRDPRGRGPAGQRPRRPARGRRATAARPSALPRVWIAVRANLRRVVEQVTIADIAAGQAAPGDRAAGRGPRRLGHPLSGARRRPRPRGGAARPRPRAPGSGGGRLGRRCAGRART